MSLVDRFFTWVVIAAVVLGVGFMILLRPAHSQVVVRLCFPPASAVGNSCIDVTAANPLPITGSLSTTGWPGTSQTTGTPISVTTGGVTGTLPSGAVVVASNIGATNTAYCKLGASATTSDAPIFPNSWVSFTVGSATQLTCITSTSTTTVNMSGGAGLPTGAGGGGSAGGSGAITMASGAVSSGAYLSGSIAAGAMVDFLTTRGTKASGTAAANSLLTGCVYTAAGITLSDGQQAACQYTSTGGVLVSVVNVNANGQATMANSSPVVIASNQTANALWGQVATGAAPPANMVYEGGLGSGATGGLARANIICDLHAFYTGTDNGSKTLVAGVSGRKTYICGWLLTTGGTATTLTLFKGTDADCATSGAAIGPPYALLANDRAGVNSPTWNGFVTATNADYVCINAGAGNAHTAEIWYAIL